MAQAGAHRRAADLGIALVVPDTSPRGLGVEGEDDQMHIGTAAGFYLDATQPKWSKYRMCAACRYFRSLLHVFFLAHVCGGVILLSLQEGCSLCEPGLITSTIHAAIADTGVNSTPEHAQSLLKELKDCLRSFGSKLPYASSSVVAPLAQVFVCDERTA